MSQVLHNNDAKAIAIPWVFSENSRGIKDRFAKIIDPCPYSM